VGISAAKGKISRWIHIPLSRSGRERKIGRFVSHGIGCLIVLGLVALAVMWVIQKVF